MSAHYTVFLVNLLQDINVLRPLVFMAALDLRLTALILVTPQFHKRDRAGIWRQELEHVASATGATIIFCEQMQEGHALLAGKRGVIVAASESNLSAHKPVHDFMRGAPSGFLKLTLQHGFECVGFRHSRDQDLAHGKTITFAADIICGWCAPRLMTSVAPTERSKLYITGPSFVLQPEEIDNTFGVDEQGIVCENMHSPRLNTAGNFKVEFLEIFAEFCKAIEAKGQRVTLRPHPGGQYVLKNNVELPANVVINNRPIYRVNLARFKYGISPPSSVLIDMVIARIPTAVWHDQSSVMDLGNYEGLARVSNVNEWVEFVQDAVANPEEYLENQQKFLAAQKILVNKADVYARFASLLMAAPPVRRMNSVQPLPFVQPCMTKRRILFVANGFIPTLQLSFIKPLADLTACGDVVHDTILESHFKNTVWKAQGFSSVHDWLAYRFRMFAPTDIVFCRYSGAHAVEMLRLAKERGIPSVFHIDDDLLSIPADIGANKQKYHNQPERLGAVRYLLDHVDLVYCSTVRLKARLIELGAEAPIVIGAIYCPGEVLVEARVRPVRKIGYMASADHVHNLKFVLKGIQRFLRKHKEVIFEFFGSITPPDELIEFGDRIRIAPKVDNYEEFLQTFAKHEWDIGICPLTPIPFNLMKANTKWVEYTSVGVAVVASRGTVYDACCADGCGMLADGEEEWFSALDKLTDASYRYRQVMAAQKKLKEQYTLERLREQVMDVFSLARRLQICRAHPSGVWQELAERQERVLYFSDMPESSLASAFLVPLGCYEHSGEPHHIITSLSPKDGIRLQEGERSAADWVRRRILDVSPSIIIFSGYAGEHVAVVLELARQQGIPTILHLGEMLMSEVEGYTGPEGLTQTRWLGSCSASLNSFDLIYCATPESVQLLRNMGIDSAIYAGQVQHVGRVMIPAIRCAVGRIGWLADDSEASFNSVLQGVQRYLRQHPDIQFDIVGLQAVPAELKEFGTRVKIANPATEPEVLVPWLCRTGWQLVLYSAGCRALSSLRAWVDFTSAGIAMIADSRIGYEELFAEGTVTPVFYDDWFQALQQLTINQELRHAQVRKAQQRLASRHSIRQLRRQLLDVFTIASVNHWESRHSDSNNAVSRAV